MTKSKRKNLGPRYGSREIETPASREGQLDTVVIDLLVPDDSDANAPGIPDPQITDQELAGPSGDEEEGLPLKRSKELDAAISPDRHQQTDLFICCDVADTPLKDVIQGMEHPLFSLSKRPSTKVFEYHYGEHWLRITPSAIGQPTIWDKDFLIYVVSTIMSAKNQGLPLSRRVKLNPYDALVFTNRGTGGSDYDRLCSAIDRLAGMTLTTNIKTGDQEQRHTFGLVDEGRVDRQYGDNGRLIGVEITLSDWMMNAINANEVLTISKDYFRLRRSIDRRVYEIARKHCGYKHHWEIGLEKLFIKSGSRTYLRDFRRSIKELSENNALPDYHVYFDEKRDVVRFTNRKADAKAQQPPAPTNDPHGIGNLPTSAYDQAKAKAPGMDVYAIEADWREFVAEQEKPNNPAGAFVNFCAYRYKISNK